MPYRLAKSLVALRAAVNAAAPLRSRASDGWIGDPAHAARTSDHNPWVKDGKTGVVTAIDITNDPAHGVDGQQLSRTLITDPRIKYVIWNRQIWAAAKAKAGWRPYTGANPHNHHVHASVASDKADYDNDKKPWDLGIEAVARELANTPPTVERHPTLRLKSQGLDVSLLQTLLDGDLKADGDFGPKTERAVKAFQKAKGLPVDGSVGPYTWDALDAIARPAGTPQALVDLPKPATAGIPTEVGSPRWTVDRLQAHGVPHLDAIALTANLIWESGGKHRANEKLAIDWSAVGDGEHSKGAGQWNDRHGRFQKLEDTAAELGTTWHDPEAQLQFLVDELKTSEYAANARLKTATTLKEKMTAALTYWRPGVPHADKRLAIAERLNKEIEDV